MKKNLTKLFALLIAVCMTAALFSACSPKAPAVDTPNTPETQTPADTEKERDPIVLKMFAGGAVAPNLGSDTMVGSVIKDKFNIDFELSLEPTNYGDAVTVMLAGGDYPDLMSLPGLAIYNQYIDSGAAVCLDDYQELLPTFFEKRADQIPYWRDNASDGKLYKWENGSPKSMEAFMNDYDTIVRTDLLEQQNWPETLSASQYIDFLTKALADNPTTDGKNTIGLTFAGAESWGVNMPFNLFEKGDRYFPAGNVCAGDIIDYKFVNRWTLPETKESAKFFNDLYRAGLLDKESYSLTDADCQAKMSTGQVAVYYYARWATSPANAALQKNGLDERQYIELPIREDSMDGQKRKFIQSLINPNETMILTKNCQNVERTLELINWWQSDEAQLLYGCGVKDEDYKVVDGKREPLDEFSAFLKGDNTTWAEKRGTLESFIFYVLGARYDNYAADGQPFRLSKDPQVVAENGLSERQKEAYTALGWENHKSWYLDNAVVYYDAIMSNISVADDSDFGKIGIQANELANQYSSKLVLSKDDAEFEKNWNAFVSEIQKLNTQSVVDEYNRQLAEQIQKFDK